MIICQEQQIFPQCKTFTVFAYKMQEFPTNVLDLKKFHLCLDKIHKKIFTAKDLLFMAENFLIEAIR